MGKTSSKGTNKKIKITSEVLKKDYKKRWQPIDTKLTLIATAIGAIIITVVLILTFGGKPLEEVSAVLAGVSAFVVGGTIAAVGWMLSGYFKYLRVMRLIESNNYYYEVVKISPITKWDEPKNSLTLKMFPVRFEFPSGLTQIIKLSLKEYKKCYRNPGEYYLISIYNKKDGIKPKNYISILSKDKYIMESHKEAKINEQQ